MNITADNRTGPLRCVIMAQDLAGNDAKRWSL